MKIPQNVRHQLAQKVDGKLAETCLSEFVALQSRYQSGDWTPSEMNAGRFVEAMARCIYQLDTGIVTWSQDYAEIRRKLESQSIQHALAAKDRTHLTGVMNLVYEFRSDRGVVHISLLYNANQVDSMFVIHSSKWLLAELVRLACGVGSKAAGEFVATLGQMEHPLVHELDGKPMVLSTRVTAAEEILLLLNHSDQLRLNPKELNALVAHIKRQTVGSALKTLDDSRQIRAGSNGDWVLTPLGQKRVLEVILPRIGSVEAA